MWRWRARIVRFALPMAVLVLLIYTADQLLTGERGIVTWRLMHQQVDILQAENARLRQDIQMVSTQVARLKPDTGNRLDEDYVDESIRRNLPMGKVGEEVIYLSGTQER